jgi:hypothetical protein
MWGNTGGLHMTRKIPDFRPFQIEDIEPDKFEYNFGYSNMSLSDFHKQMRDQRIKAAAPDLLEALELIIADFADYPASERPCLAFDRARAAIAKAKGE